MSPITAKVVGERLRALQEKSGMTQGQLAEASATSRTRLNTYLRGHRIPDLVVLERLAHALGVRLRDLVDPD